MREQGKGAALFGYTKLYGQVPGGQAEFLRVPQAQFGPIKVPEGPPDDRFVYLSDVLPTAWQAVEYAAIPDGRHRGRARARADRRHGRADRAAPRRRGSSASTWSRSASSGPGAHGVEVLDLRERSTTSADAIRELTDGRGPDAVIDAVGMEAHGSPAGQARPDSWPGCCPTRWPAKLMEKAGVDRLARAAPRDRRSSAAAARSRCPASTAAWPTRCR